MSSIDAIVTIEKETFQSSIDSVRIYHNWRSDVLDSREAEFGGDAGADYTKLGPMFGAVGRPVGLFSHREDPPTFTRPQVKCLVDA